ncbi:hypothetical protein TNCT_552291 [Trichonephila clavata]|uniref:Uncharacterized protein n=1 Tax=Trichonephila clavata TaxID=2740835 RepID=A0A8X6FGS1_TRICU|nr:hypothetical protein TNCT_552291 [Trichonephila clavata]
MKRYNQKAYKLDPPTPAHSETSKPYGRRPLEEEVYPLSKKHFRIPKKSPKIIIKPVVRSSVMIARPALAAPQPVSIPPVQTRKPEPPVSQPSQQISLPDSRVSQPPQQTRLPDSRVSQPPQQIQLTD